MKLVTSIILGIIFICGISGCSSNDKSKIIEKYKTGDSHVKLNETLQKNVGSWIEEGKECYGIIQLVDDDRNVLSQKEIKAVVLIIQSNKIKMKSLEDVSLAPKAGCSKMGITKGETWWEEEALFQTREEAIAYQKSIQIKHKSPVGAKFTID